MKLDPNFETDFRLSRIQPRPYGHVYFVEAIGTGRVKIGWSKDIHARMNQIRTGCPVEIAVLLTKRARQSAEFALHRRFADQRVWTNREWFTLEGPIREFIQSRGRTILAPAREAVSQ